MNEIKLITTRDRARNAAENWRQIYTRFHRGEWAPEKLLDGRSPKAIHEQLVALGPDPAPEQVDAVIGNNYWTGIVCNQCERRSPAIDAIVTLGERPNYESSTANVCRDCVIAALKAFDSWRRTDALR